MAVPFTKAGVILVAVDYTLCPKGMSLFLVILYCRKYRGIFEGLPRVL